MAYYACEPDMRHHKDRRQWYADHPKSLWIREDDLLDLVHEFFAERVFGPHRMAAVRAHLAKNTPKDDTALKRLKKEILDLDKRQNNVLAQIEDHVPTGDNDIDRDFRQRLQRRYADLAHARKAKAEELKTLTEHEPQTGQDYSLLSELPTLAQSLSTVPEDLQRRLFEAFNLELRYRPATHQVLIRVRVKADNMPAIKAATKKIATPPGREAAPEEVSLVLGAPGGVLHRWATP